MPLTALHRRIAEHLGWTLDEVGSLSLPALRELVTSDKLRHEISVVVRGGLHVASEPRPNRILDPLGGDDQG